MATTLRPDARVARIAAIQHGVVTRQQLLNAGLSGSAIARRVARGWLHRLHPAVFAVGHSAVSPQARWLAATLACGDRAVLSHRSAAALWGIGMIDVCPEVTVSGARRRGPSGIRMHHGRLEEGDVVVQRGVRVTAVARTLLDLAEVLTLKQLVEVLDRALARRLLDSRAIADQLDRAIGRRGLRGLRAALLVVRPQDVLTRSELERRALRLISAHRLPKPEVNVRLHGYEVDLLWRTRTLVVELDGREWHDTPAAFERDRRRDADLMAHGWRILRLTWRQVVNDPAWTGSRIRRVLDIAAA